MDLDPESRVIFRFDHSIPKMQQQTLEAYLASTPRRAARLKFGLVIIMTVLKLGPDWVPMAWSKNSVGVLDIQKADSSAVISKPYFSHNSIHTTLKALPMTLATNAQKARASLLTLGIILLELLFRETLEQQPFHAEFFSDGKANEFTDLCAAWRWQKKVEEEFGEKIANAIRLCVTCEFDSPNLESQRFINAVWSSVAKPVEEFLQAYS
jgi:hypothetical protein